MFHQNLSSVGSLSLVALALVAGLLAEVKVSHAETLPNGIELPEQWPPQAHPFNGEPMPVPYLKAPPKVIPIDLGRQLLVDDFLIAETTLKRSFHSPELDPRSPVVKPDRPWEIKEPNPQGKNDQEKAGSASAGAYSDGVWFDPQQQKFLMWYRGEDRTTCLATSENGIHWTKPELDVEPGTNIVLRTIRDSTTVILDQHTTDPRERFKLFEARYQKRNWEIGYHRSTDGVHWSEERMHSGPSWDRSTMFWNPFREVWVASVRGHNFIKPDPVNRIRNYHEGRTVAEALGWKQHTDLVAKGEERPGGLQRWVASDRLDPHHPDPRFRDEAPQLYNLDAFPYESLLVGLFTIWQGPQNEVCAELGIQKRNEVFVGFSRDGFHWDRANRRVFLPVSENKEDWNGYNVQSVGGGCVIVDDELYFYCSGRTSTPIETVSTGLAKMRRDGFASMDAGENGGTLTTRPVRFTGRHLFVNADLGEGELRVEVLDEAGKVIPGFQRSASEAITGDHTKAAIKWKAADSLKKLAGRPVRFRFHLTGGSLYSFWVSSSEQGTSGGYVAAGGPAYDGPRDE